MPRIPMVNADAIGMVQDQSTNEIDVRAFSLIQNARIQEGSIERIMGHQPALVPPPDNEDPLWLIPAPLQEDYYWIWATADKVYAYATGSGAHQDITRASGPYNAGPRAWNGGIFNGLFFCNNGADVPQVWLTPGPSTPLVDLPNFTPDCTVKYLSSFKNYLVALNVTKGAEVFPQMVKWSHIADPGDVPNSWDITDPTKDAGEFPLSETPGVLMGQLTMRDANILYKDDSVYAMTYTGGTSIFRFQRILKEGGLITPYGVKKFNLQGEKHIVFSSDDIFIHDGVTATAILQKRMRRWLYSNMDTSTYMNSFIVTFAQKSEAWICFPMNGSFYPNMALIYNYRNQSLSIRELPNVSYADTGVVTDITGAGASAIWESDLDIWDTDKTNWGERTYNPSSDKILMAKPDTTQSAGRNFYAADVTDLFDGVPFTTTIERDGITIVGQDRSGQPIQDLAVYKLLSYIWPRIETDANLHFEYYVGTQTRRTDPISWEGPFPFDAKNDRHVCPLVSGLILSIKLVVADAGFFRYNGYDIQISPTGAW